MSGRLAIATANAQLGQRRPRKLPVHLDLRKMPRAPTTNQCRWGRVGSSHHELHGWRGLVGHYRLVASAHPTIGRMTSVLPLSLERLPAAARQWYATLPEKKVVDADALLRSAVAELPAQYAGNWESAAPTADSSRWTNHRNRVALGVAYHWWRWWDDTSDLEQVIQRVRSGHLAYGRVKVDVLSEIVLTECCCQGDNDAAAYFMQHFDPLIRATARRVGGPRAEQEIQDFAAQLFLPREQKPARLALFAGFTPLEAWLRQVVRNEWLARLRKEQSSHVSDSFVPEHASVIPGPDELAEGQECVKILREAFAEVVGELSIDDSVLLRMILIDGVPQQQVAKVLGVHKSTITRHRQRACEQLLAALKRRLSDNNQGRNLRACMRWLSEASSELKRNLGMSVAGLLETMVESSAGEEGKDRDDET